MRGIAVKVRDLRRRFVHELEKRLGYQLRLGHTRIKPLLIVATTIVSMLLMLTGATSLFETNRAITTFGSVKAVGIGVYWDLALLNSVSTINWGAIEPGSINSVNVCIKNEGNSAIILTQNTTNWNPPEAADYMTLSWNYDGQSLGVSGAIQVTLTLTISASIANITTFSFDIMIKGSS